MAKEISNQDLAETINNSFGDLEDKINSRFDKLEQGQEDIKLRLDNVAYRFELVELQKRVERLEKKAHIRYKAKSFTIK